LFSDFQVARIAAWLPCAHLGRHGQGARLAQTHQPDALSLAAVDEASNRMGTTGCEAVSSFTRIACRG
jgi:hypothetical protein